MIERRTDDATLIEALRILSRTIKDGDGVIPACLAEAATRLEEKTRGWLTAEERAAVELAAEQVRESDFVSQEDGDRVEAVLRSLLARSKSPEVVLPPMVIAYDDMDMLKEALAKAGVAWKEAK